MKQDPSQLPAGKEPLVLRASLRELAGEGTTVALAVLLYSMAYQMFLLPGGIYMGSFTGIATLLYRLFGLPTGMMLLAMNLPLLFWNFKFYGLRFCLRSTVGIVLISLTVDRLHIFPQTLTDPILCAIGGGITIGVGSGLLFSRGYTSGGSDLIAWVLKKFFPDLSTGKLLLLVEGVLLLIPAIVFRNFETAFYGGIATYLSGRCLDMTVSGTARSKIVLVFSKKYREIANEILNKMQRGVTFLDGTGAYTGNACKVLLCAIRPTELFQVKRIVSHADPNAFVLICDASEVNGSGFRRIAAL